jgi:hypothetical protein
MPPALFTAIIKTISSKSEPNPKLHLSWNSRSSRRPPKAGRRNIDRSNTERSSGRHFEDRVIESIDHLRPDLHPYPLLDERHRLGQRQVGGHELRTIQINKRSELAGRGWRGEKTAAGASVAAYQLRIEEEYIRP